jgi:hypothetical protein
MQKIPTLFKRDGRPHRATDQVEEGCEWVLAGEGVATIKIDGTCCAIINGQLHRRHRHKEDKGAPPEGWVHWSLDESRRSGHGWLPVSNKNPSDRYHVEAIGSAGGWPLPDGTYELVGPKIQRNPYSLDQHLLWAHGSMAIEAAPKTLEDVRLLLEAVELEGIVWKHPDGRMAKIKRSDFGLPWPVAPKP